MIIKSPWDFSAPEYDHRSSCYINAGCYQGVGMRQPIGSESQKKGSPIPQKPMKWNPLNPNDKQG